MEPVGGWALIIGRKILKTGGFDEELRGLGFGAWLSGRNKIVPSEGKNKLKSFSKFDGSRTIVWFV